MNTSSANIEDNLNNSGNNPESKVYDKEADDNLINNFDSKVDSIYNNNTDKFYKSENDNNLSSTKINTNTTKIKTLSVLNHYHKKENKLNDILKVDSQIISSTNPIRWWYLDTNLQTFDEKSFPNKEWKGWEISYDNQLERGKYTTRRQDVLSTGLVEDIESTSDIWSCKLGYNIYQDVTKHGAGLHVMEPEGYLQTHLDYCRHPILLDKKRSFNMIFCLHDKWENDWGGELCFHNPLGEVVKRILPKPGRLIAFEVNDLSYHSVAKITGPQRRVTLAVYFLSKAGPEDTRQRALFMPVRN